MKIAILSLIISMMHSLSAQARVAFVDPMGNLIDPKSTGGITAAEADMVVKAVEVAAPSSTFYEDPLIIGGAIFSMLLVGFVLFLKRRK